MIIPRVRLLYIEDKNVLYYSNNTAINSQDSIHIFYLYVCSIL